MEILNITNEQINQFVNDIQKESALSNQTIDKSVLLSTIDSLKRTFPVTLLLRYSYTVYY